MTCLPNTNGLSAAVLAGLFKTKLLVHGELSDCVSHYYQNLLNAIIPVIMTKCEAISYSMNLLPNSHKWFKHYLSEGKMCLTEWCQSLFNYTVNKYDSQSISQDVTVTMNTNYLAWIYILISYLWPIMYQEAFWKSTELCLLLCLK